MIGRVVSAIALVFPLAACQDRVDELIVEGIEAPAKDAWPTAAVLAAVVERNPWAMVIGADNPRVLLFGDGSVIRWDPEEGSRPAFTTARLTPAELVLAKDALGPIEDFAALKDLYDLAPGVTDQATVEISRTDGPTSVSVMVYGFEAETVATFASTRVATATRPETCPAEFERLYKLLIGLNPTNSTRWFPRYLEVMVWPYDHSPEEPLAWPEEWPGLESKWVIQRRQLHSLFLDGELEDELRSYIESLGEKQAVLMAGRKWSVAYRPVTPGSEVAEEMATLLELELNSRGEAG